MTTRKYVQHHATEPRGRMRAPRWMRWTAYMMCGWSLIFAVLHFVSAADWTPVTNEGRRIEADPLAWFLCAGILCVIGTVAALALIQSRTQCFPRSFMLSSSLSGGVLVVIYVIFSFWVNDFHWALAPGVLCVVGALAVRDWRRQRLHQAHVHQTRISPSSTHQHASVIIGDLTRQLQNERDYRKDTEDS